MTPDQFWAHVDKRPDGCWVWQGTKDPLGYGRISMRLDGVRVQLAHRAAFILTHGYHPPELDHACRNPSCVRPEPDHLEPVGQAENMRRAIAFGGQSPAWQAARAWAEGHCLHGHSITPETIGVNNLGQRFCRECRRATVRRYDARKRAQRSAA